jgi:hypothetical protein
MRRRRKDEIARRVNPADQRPGALRPLPLAMLLALQLEHLEALEAMIERLVREIAERMRADEPALLLVDSGHRPTDRRGCRS